MARRPPAIAPLLLLATAVLASASCGNPTSVIFGVLADAQFAAAPPSGSRSYDRSWLKVRDALEVFNGRGVRFVVHLGDLIDHDAVSYDSILTAFAHSRAPVRFVLGNHDFDIAPELRTGVLSRLGIGRGYYAFSESGWRFIVLNGDELGFNFPKDEKLSAESGEMFAALSAAGRPNATKWNGGVGRDQLAFLEAELGAADREGRPAAVFCHFPVFPPAGHNLWNDEAVVAVLEKHASAKAYFSGHNHAGDFAVKNGIAYLTFSGLVETPDTGSGAVVTLTLDRLLVDGLGREPDREVPLRRSPD
ncbi:MAG: phosphatase [Candidatus Aminicenantes bacterium]|nr:MAG: phosphatase [Candidatus Aminicenantes bacterium]RPJ00027.1 MAG: phosphatase [Candidatus Aminicenantes bacterium]